MFSSLTRHSLPGLVPILVLLMMGEPAPVAAQEDAAERSSRPRIGLALGGGGARGGAHVGVLARLEELRIPIDYIAGTSIGSIVGGLYASGLSPAEMSEAIQSIDWEAVFNDSPSRRDQPFRRKEESFLDLFAIEVGISRGGVRIPAGLVAGQRLNFLLRELTLHAAYVEDFDELGVPFRAIATDLDTGEAVVMGGGDLADAMRASMAIPGFFTPAVHDGKMLVDGGVVQNLPVEVVKAMGADIVIAVDVGTPPGEIRGDQMSLLGVASRTVSVLTAANTKESRALLGEDDFLLVPDLEGITTLGFAMIGEAEERGLAVVDTVEAALRKLSVSEEEYGHYLQRQRSVTTHREAKIRIDRIEFVGGGRVPEEMVRRRMRIQPGDDLDLDRLKQDLRRVFQIGEFDLIDFHIRQRGDETVLQIETREKFWGPDYLRFGMRIEGSFKGSGGFLLNVLHRKSFINSYGAEWRNLLTFGDLLRLRTEFDQPLGYGARFFLAPTLVFTRVEGGAYLDPRNKVLLDGDVGTGQFDLGYRIGNDFELRVGAQFGFVKADFGLVDAEEKVDDQLALFRARVVMDDLDAEAFPRFGGYAEFRADLGRKSLGSTEHYDRLHLVLLQPVTRGHTTFAFNLEAGHDLSSDLPIYEEFTLGGLFRMSGLEAGQLRGDTMLRVGLLWMQHLGDLNQLLGRGIYAGLSLEAGNALPSGEPWQLSSFIPAGAVYAGVQSVLGPAYLGWGLAEGGHNSFYVLLGHPHRLGLLH